jgi:hypothetical protein
LLDTFYTDFNTGKLIGVWLRKFERKNIFAEKYDEIRRLDGILLSDLIGSDSRLQIVIAF